jgi:hypothetical protein
MHGPTCIFWANLTPFSLQRHAAAAAEKVDMLSTRLEHCVAKLCTGSTEPGADSASESSQGSLEPSKKRMLNETMRQVRKTLTS